MRFFKSSCIVFSFVLVLTGAAMATDYVDIGDPFYETGHNMTSWGPIEPANSSGTFGGIDHCRAIWSSLDNSVNATIDLNFASGTEALWFKHLEGIADDGFEVYVNGVLKYTHIENTSTEQWVVNFVAPPFQSGVLTVEFVATGPAWSGWATYGQVCFAEVWVGNEDPVSLEKDSWGNVKSLFR